MLDEWKKADLRKKGFPVFQYPHFQIEVKCEILYVFYLRIKTYFQVKDFALDLASFKKETSCNWEVGYYRSAITIKTGAGDPMVAVTKRGETCAGSKS